MSQYKCLHLNRNVYIFRIGVDNIKVDKYYLHEEALIVKGENFTYKSSILINGNIVPTKFVDKNTLVSYEYGKDIENISVGQIGKYNKILNESNSIK